MGEPARTNMTVKGQVTIPRDLRRWAGIEPGHPVDVMAGPDGAVQIRAVRPELSVEERVARMDATIAWLKARGPHPDGMTTDEYMATIREPVLFDPDR